MTEQNLRANQEMVSARRRGLSGRARKIVVFVVSLLVLLALGAGGAAYATLDYAERYEGRILPGSRVGGIDVGGMTSSEAYRAVKRSIKPELTRRITLRYEDRAWTATPKELGVRSTARAAVRSALASSDHTTFLDKARMRWLGDRHAFDSKVALRYPKEQTSKLAAGIAKQLDREPVDAAMDYSSGWVEFTDARTGRRVDDAATSALVMKALKKDRSTVRVPVAIIEPETTTADFDQVLLVRIGENKLYLYEDGKITSSWPVATGQPEYPTPTGLYSVELKRYLPTWVNPSPDTWGADLPAEIPPGPDNPLGLRAINWTAPAIRFHGTEAIYSLGYNASHGCVRMANSDVIELYDRIEVGTPIVSVVAGELKPLYTSTSVVDQATSNGETGDEETAGIGDAADAGEPTGDGKGGDNEPGSDANGDATGEDDGPQSG